MFNDRSRLFIVILLLVMLSIVCAIFAFYYQASFTRYHADDYCNSARFDSPGVSDWLLSRYLNKSGRYSNILYVGIMDVFGLAGIRFGPSLMLTIWVFALAWSSAELRRVFHLDGLPVIIDYVLAGMLIAISIYSAPNRFQTIFWRTGMATHFVPLVFLSFLIPYLFWRSRRAGNIPLTRWTLLFVLFYSFVTAGFSEPPVTVMITSGIVSLVLLAYFGGLRKSRSMSLLLAYALAGSLAGFFVMFFAPGKAFRLDTPPAMDVFILRTLIFPLEFITDTLRVSPLPTLFLLCASAAMFYCAFSVYGLPGARIGATGLRIAIILLAMYILIAASFAPSAYGQSYPVARARFLGYLIFNIAVLSTGGLIGIWLAKHLRLTLGISLSLGLLALLTLYPLKITTAVLDEARDSRVWAQAWDLRDAEIRSLQSQGVTDLIVARLPDVSDVGEIRTSGYVNNCAARFYGINSITTAP